MLKLYYTEFCYLLPMMSIFYYSWFFFIESNFMNVKVKTLKTDKISPTNIVKKIHYSLFINWINLQLITVLISLILVKGYTSVFLWDHFFLNNFNLLLIQTSLFLIMVIFTIFKTLITNNINYSTDYFFSLNNLIIFLILIFLTNNLFAFIFLLELNSILIFYKFVVSKYWYKSTPNLNEKKQDLENRHIPKNYLNMLFFQYWSTFFSSILIFFSLANIFYLYGSTEFFFLEYLSLINNNNSLIKINFINFIWIPFLVGFLMKIGLTPFHLFKIEVYKGLPIISILVYTTFYFFIYFIYFTLLLNYQLDFLKIFLNSILFIIIITGAIYIMSLLYDVTALKSFFAYSTIINSLLFFVATYLY